MMQRSTNDFLSLMACATLMFAMTGCNGGNSTPTPAGTSSTATEASLPDVAIPTQEEADAAAAAAITAENADAEFEALMREIESETDE